MTTTTNELTIAEVAERSGVTAHTLRYYERIGLLEPVGRAATGHRRYSEDDLGRLEVICKLRRTGMTLQHVGEFIRMIREGEGTERARLDLLQTHRARVVAELDELQECLAFIDYKIDLYRRSVR
jgi:DNA-binding transcriptional MerR regulator